MFTKKKVSIRLVAVALVAVTSLGASLGGSAPAVGGVSADGHTCC
ncbi:hypothetical protein [Nocardioides sp. WS12]|nr:hypothetical protein [Nocardioides sp. WS12]